MIRQPYRPPSKLRRLIWRARHGAAKWPERLLGQSGKHVRF